MAIAGTQKNYGCGAFSTGPASPPATKKPLWWEWPF